MSGVWAWIVGIVGSLGGLAALIYWLKTISDNKVALDQRDAALQVEQQHVAAQEAAREAQRAQRATDLDAKLQATATADDAAHLLRDTFHAGVPKTH